MLNESGQYTRQFYKNTHIFEGPSSSGMGGLVVVDQFSKAVDENGECKNEKFRRIIKHDYSTMVCVYPSTVSKLQDSGWAVDNRTPEKPDSHWIIGEDHCREWCDQNELYELGCNEPILIHLEKYSNLFDEEFDGVYGIEDIGLPDGVSQEKFEECVDIIYEKRTSMELENET